MSLNAKQDKKWIQGAIKKEGSLREYIRKKYGNKAFTEQGTIRVSVLRELANDPEVSEKTRKRARLALALREIRKK